MFSNLTVALLVGIGLGAWIYSKMYRSSGGNNQSALTIAGGAALLAFLVVLLILNWVF